MRIVIAALCLLVVTSGPVLSEYVQKPPSLQAGISIGFNYDLIKPPTDVSFEYPKAFFGLNIPFKYNGSQILESSLKDIAADTSIFREGTQLKPEVSAKQNANATVRVDVPMLGGVATFANTQNLYLNYVNSLGNPKLSYKMASDDTASSKIDLNLVGTVSVPLELTIGWETMTFGYAYRISKNLSFALNLHRHVFNFDLAANINVDLLGRVRVQQTTGGAGGEAASGLGADIKGDINYPSTIVNGSARGHYEAEVWSPTIGVQLWRFTLSSRIGVNTRAEGYLEADYTIPFFLDAEDFQPTIDFDKTEQLMDLDFINPLLANETHGLRYWTRDDMRWKMPSGHTLSFDIVRDKLNLSYTKFFGEVAMSLGGIRKELTSGGTLKDTTEVGFDIGLSVDNIIMLSGKFKNAFFNLGVFALDFRSEDKEHILGNAVSGNMPWLMLGKSMMVPVLNVGSTVGSKLQLLLELDIVPLPAVKTGVYYYF